MAAKDLKRSIPSAQPKRRRLNPHLKIRAYETLFHLNRGFTITAINLDRLDRLGIFRPDSLRAYRNQSEELRALTNTNLLATLRDRETKDAFRFQNVRLKSERRFKASPRK